ncbi:hypothetical protein EWB00_000801, partial [Schistosoma japonicum]
MDGHMRSRVWAEPREYSQLYGAESDGDVDRRKAFSMKQLIYPSSCLITWGTKYTENSVCLFLPKCFLAS